MPRYKFRTLLAQFGIRDLFWLILVAAVVSLANRDRRAMKTQVDKMEAERAVEKADLELVKAGHRERYEKLSKTVNTLRTRIDAANTPDARADELQKAERDDAQRRSRLGIPPSQKEAAPGIYFLQ